MSLIDAALRLARAIRLDARNLGFALRHCHNAAEVARAVLRRAGETTAVMRDGPTIVAPEAFTLPGLLDEVFVERAYDRGHVHVRPGDVVVDIGAHVGAFVVHALLEGAARVIAYEPSPHNVSYLRRNLEVNGARNVEIVEAAVAGSEGVATLSLGAYSVGNVLSVDAPPAPLQPTVTVHTTTLAGIFAAHDIERIDYLKIDCEGSEGALLSASPPEILRRVERIALEYHDELSSLDHRRLAALLIDAGFSVEVVPRARRTYGMIYAWR